MMVSCLRISFGLSLNFGSAYFSSSSLIHRSTTPRSRRRTTKRTRRSVPGTVVVREVDPLVLGHAFVDEVVQVGRRSAGPWAHSGVTDLRDVARWLAAVVHDLVEHDLAAVSTLETCSI